GQWFASGFLQSEPRDSDLASGYVLGATARTSGLSPCRVRSCRAHIKKAVEAATGKETQILPVYKNDRLFIGAIIKNESPVTGEDIKRWRSLLLNKVEPLVVPRLWRNVTEFPMTAQGKLDTACLLELFDE
ncbi:hypothetical protein, partial [Parasutterella excrementihominis]|uniref:hypothetical protein n=2 Tax=Parasutterella excrementihominis TaxID=487175 RepID=UPI003A928BE1